MNKFYSPNGELRSSWLSLARGMQGGQAATLAKQTSWNQSMDEKQDTAVRYLKKQKQRGQQKFKTIRLQI